MGKSYLAKGNILNAIIVYDSVDSNLRFYTLSRVVVEPARGQARGSHRDRDRYDDRYNRRGGGRYNDK